MYSIKRLVLILMILVSSRGLVYTIDFKGVVKLGVGFSNMSQLDQERSKFAVTGGGGLIVFLDDPFSFELDMLYQLKGSLATRTDYSASYLSFPLTVRARLIEHVSLIFGPQISVLLFTQTNQQNVTGFTKPLDFGLVFGMNYYFSVGDDRIIFEFIVDVGLVDVTKANHPFLTGSNKNRAGYVALGWMFSL